MTNDLHNISKVAWFLGCKKIFNQPESVSELPIIQSAARFTYSIKQKPGTMNAKSYVFVATATASIVVCIVSFSGPKESKLLPASKPEAFAVIYEPTESTMPPELSDAAEVFEYKGMKELLAEMDAKPQKFSFDPTEVQSINGKEGTVITFPANAFVDEDGNEPTGSIKIDLREYYSIQEILAAKLQTKAGDRILESGGMLHIEATSNGKKLKLKDGVVCEMKFPKNDEDEDYKLFTGARDEEEVMDWTLAEMDGEMTLQTGSFQPGFLDGVFVSEGEGFETERQMNLDCFIQIVSSYRRDLFYINKMDYFQWKFQDVPQDLNTYFLSNFNPSVEMLNDFCEGKMTCEVQISIRENGTIRNAMVTKSCKPEYDEMFMDFVTNLPVLDTEQLLKTPDDNNAFVLRFGKATGTNKDAAAARFRSKYKGKEDKEMTSVSSTDLNFYVFNSSDLGWINCDRFDVEPGEMVDVEVESSFSDSCYVSMVFEDMNSVLLGINQGDKIVFNGVPKNREVKIVSVRCVNGKPDVSTVKTITSSQPVKMEKYEPLTIARLDEEFKGFMQ